MIQSVLGQKCVDSFRALQDKLRQSVKLSHRKERKTLCLITDASGDNWAKVVTQCDHPVVNKPMVEQCNDPLTFAWLSSRVPSETGAPLKGQYYIL